MSNNKTKPDGHTPAPWSAHEGAHNEIIIGAAKTPHIARIPITFVSINEWKANARLIQNAPRLLAALERYVDEADEAGPDYSGSYDALDEARQILADVRGTRRTPA